MLIALTYYSKQRALVILNSSLAMVTNPPQSCLDTDIIPPLMTLLMESSVFLGRYTTCSQISVSSCLSSHLREGEPVPRTHRKVQKDGQ